MADKPKSVLDLPTHDIVRYILPPLYPSQWYDKAFLGRVRAGKKLTAEEEKLLKLIQIPKDDKKYIVNRVIDSPVTSGALGAVAMGGGSYLTAKKVIPQAERMLKRPMPASLKTALTFVIQNPIAQSLKKRPSWKHALLGAIFGVGVAAQQLAGKTVHVQHRMDQLGAGEDPSQYIRTKLR